jgi:protein-S-isoprenylcysteine O-methyltransferase Ste14
MGLDIRWPIGLMFTLIGAILVVCGIVTNSDVEMYKRSLGMNINLIWGALLFIFGLLMLISAKMASNAEKKNKK